MKKLCMITIMIFLLNCASVCKISASETYLLQKGITSKQVVERFGKPKSTNTQVCGSGENAFSCMIYHYGVYGSMVCPHVQLVFSYDDDNQLRLIGWN